MKADKDDAPHYVRHRQSNRWQRLAILGIGSVAFWIAVFMHAKPITIDIGQLQKAIRFGDEDEAERQHIATERARASAEFLAEPHATPAKQPQPETQAPRPAAPSQAPIPAEQQPRQTVFNDQNYKPRMDVNTVSMQSTTMAKSEQAHSRPQQKAPIRKGPERWEWASSTNRETGWLYWDELNGQIEWDSVCNNEKYGSFRYRDCRKAAKVTFARICGYYKPACMAENQYRPL